MSTKTTMLIEKLRLGETIAEYREAGNSMIPIIHSKEAMTLSPVDIHKIEVGDVVFCKVKGKFYTHIVTAADDKRVQISNNHGYVNGWTSRDKVYGIVTSVNGRARPNSEHKVLKKAISKE